MQTIDTAMLLAAGLGTRLKPFTDHHPKALAMVNGKTVLQRNVEYLKNAGIKNIVVNVHHFASQIIDIVNQHNGWGTNMLVSDESDLVLETGGGLQKASLLFKDAANIVLMNADILTDMPLADMMQYHLQQANDATLATSNRVSGRCFLFDAETHQLTGWRNRQTGETKQPVNSPVYYEASFSGIHIINKSIFRNMPFTGRFSMVDVYLAMCPEKKICSFDHSGSKFVDIGTMEKLEKAAGLFS